MSQVNQSTANWRLFGGGGLAVGGLLYALAALLNKDGDKDVFWLYIIGLVVAGVGFFFVARGESGSNGAVGADQVGKLALYAAGGLFILEAFLGYLVVKQDTSIDETIFDIIQIATIVALALAAYSIANKGIAKGLAASAMYAVAAWALVIQIMEWADEYNWWTAFIFGLTLLGTGVLYALNN